MLDGDICNQISICDVALVTVLDTDYCGAKMEIDMDTSTVVDSYMSGQSIHYG